MLALFSKNIYAWLAAVCVPLFYLFQYTPYGMDTTDFGYFYGYAWRILEGQIPYRDFAYIKPAFPLYWHAFWLWLTPQNLQVLAGKAGFLATLLASSWLSALYLNKIFNFKKLALPLPLLATAGFVFSIHSFPHMPWHTADGVFFCALALCLSAFGHPFFAGLFAACAMLCKQSFLLVPFAIILFIWFYSSRKKACIYFLAAWLGFILVAWCFLYFNGAWEQFRRMTTGQLDFREALDAGLLIYLRQNWLLPALAVIPWLCARFFGKRLPDWLMPAYCYLAILSVWYIYNVYTQKTWIGFGASWPTLFMLLGGLCILLPRQILLPYARQDGSAFTLLGISCAFGAMLLASWSVAISGGYKIPAMMATPLLFSFFLIHARMGKNILPLAWATIACGLLIFGSGYQYPYVFPARSLERSSLNMDAGEVYPVASGVKVDREMFEKLRELKQLREKYGPMYKTLPGFPFSYYLNGDKPVYGSDWLIDWEINGDIDRMYQELLDKNLTVFMERDQMDTAKADNYDRAGYSVPQRVRKLWRVVEETPHFVVFQPPLPENKDR